ncbi:hypothetical protein JCM10212_000344 [Sporobolomyces blumeae]
MAVQGFPAGERTFEPLLSPGAGYGVVVGVGFFFALGMILLTQLQNRYTRINSRNAEEFVAASRSVKPGLICCGIVSSWTWSATLLQSSVATYTNGLSCAWWYGVGGTIQIVFFAALAAKVKQNANGCVTFLQIVRARYGRLCHALMTLEALVCAHVVTGSLILGASATISALTGANIVACNFLLPAGIAVYVLAGGLRATFIVDYLHTLCLFVILYFFLFSTYGTSDLVGSPGKLYDLLKDASKLTPVDGNFDGSYLTMKSNGGLLFAASTIATGFSSVFLDQAYWQRALASRPESTTKAYMMGGLAWFGIPFAFGSCMGLACRALSTNPSFPTFPYALSATQVSAGLVAPAAAATLLGKAGAAAMLVLVFMAATSACSAELIAVSSLVTFDIVDKVRTNKLTAKQTLWVSELAIAGYAVWSGAWSTILHFAGIDLGILFFINGVLLTPAVPPIFCVVVWRKASQAAILTGTLFGTACALSAWCVACYKCYGAVNVVNLALPYSAVSGASAGLVMSTLAVVTVTLIRPDNYDWSGTRAVTMVSESTPVKSHVQDHSSRSSTTQAEDEEKSHETDQKASTTASAIEPVTLAKDGQAQDDDDEGAGDRPREEPLDLGRLQKVFKRAAWGSGTLALIVTIIIPFPLFFSHYVFSRRFFEAWIGISCAWCLLSGIFCILLPIFESRVEIFRIARNAVRALIRRDSACSDDDVVA